MNPFLKFPSKFVRPGACVCLFGLSFIAASTFAPTAHAATVCVDAHNKPGCYSTISAAVAAAGTGDTVSVNSGTYKEDVVIGQSLSLVGQDASTTIIDATGLANGIYVDGLDNANLADVVISGFTVTNAKFEGILVNNATGVTISGNVVTNNDRSLQPSNVACPGLPAFETSEDGDCGEGIHLMGATHTVVADNLVQENAGGILVSDETNSTHDDVIERNLIQNNHYASGITIASHPGAPVAGSVNNDIYDITVLNNDSVHNGFGGSGGGAGISISAPIAGNRTFANVLIGNRLVGNSMPGVVIYAGPPSASSVKNPDASRNAIIANYIASNGPYAALPTTVGTGIAILGLSPVIDSMVTSNFIEDEGIDVAFNSGSTLDLHLNDFGGRQIGIANVAAGGGIVNARENWWGCSNGPGGLGCTKVAGASVTVTPWLQRPMDGTLGHGLDHYFDFIHSYDCDHNSNGFNQDSGGGFGQDGHHF